MVGSALLAATVMPWPAAAEGDEDHCSEWIGALLNPSCDAGQPIYHMGGENLSTLDAETAEAAYTQLLTMAWRYEPWLQPAATGLHSVNSKTGGRGGVWLFAIEFPILDPHMRCGVNKQEVWDFWKRFAPAEDFDQVRDPADFPSRTRTSVPKRGNRNGQFFRTKYVLPKGKYTEAFIFVDPAGDYDPPGSPPMEFVQRILARAWVYDVKTAESKVAASWALIHEYSGMGGGHHDKGRGGAAGPTAPTYSPSPIDMREFDAKFRGTHSDIPDDTHGGK